MKKIGSKMWKVYDIECKHHTPIKIHTDKPEPDNKHKHIQALAQPHAHKQKESLGGRERPEKRRKQGVSEVDLEETLAVEVLQTVLLCERALWRLHGGWYS